MIKPRVLALLLCLLFPATATGRVTDYQWKLIQRSFDKLWASKDFKKRQSALRKLGFADRMEAARKLVELIGADGVGDAETRKARDELLRTWDLGMKELDGFNKILGDGNFLTEEQEDDYNKLSKNLKRWNRRMYKLDKQVTRADLLLTDALEQLVRIKDDEARKYLHSAAATAGLPVHARVCVIQSLWMAREAAAVPTLRTLVTDEQPAVAAIAVRALLAIETSFVARQGLVKLLVGQLDSLHWQVRDAAIWGLSTIKSIDAVAPLVARLQKEVGRLTEDIGDALAAITDHHLGASPKAWKVWYDANKDRLEEVIKAHKKVVASEGQTIGAITFYGIRTMSRRICFVIDISGSMSTKAGKVDPAIVAGDRRYPTRGTQMQIAKYELRKAIGGLADDARFNLVYFNEMVRIRAEAGMLGASAKEKKTIDNWIRSDVMKANGGTNIFDALRRALTLAPHEIDTIYFLTDGTPKSGQIKDTKQILSEIRIRNQRLGLKIHVVGVGKAVSAEFLRQLAAQNRGRFVHTNK